MENGFGMNGKVVGVIRDFNFKSLHSPVEPLILMYAQQPYGTLNVKLAAENREQTLAQVETLWKEFDRDHPMEYALFGRYLGRELQARSTKCWPFSAFSRCSRSLFRHSGCLAWRFALPFQRTKENTASAKVMGSSYRPHPSAHQGFHIETRGGGLARFHARYRLGDAIGCGTCLRVDLSPIHFLVPAARFPLPYSPLRAPWSGPPRLRP